MIERNRKTELRAQYLRRKGITEEIAQDDCDLCGQRMHQVVYDHPWGVTVAQICKACSMGLACFGRDTRLLAKAIAYLVGLEKYRGIE